MSDWPTPVPKSNLVDDHRVAQEFKKLARKLRWLGQADDAAQLESALAKIAPEEFVLLLPDDTD